MKGLAIGDIHFGINESTRLFKELHQFTDYLKNDKEINFVVFTGDFFHRRLMANEPAVNYGISFFIDVFNIMKERENGTIRMIQGTRTHDLNLPYNIFSKFQEDDSVNFRIIEKVEKESIDGFNFLYIPEEYPQDSDEYYKPFREGKYDAIFGHGTWDFVAMQSQIEHGNRTDILSAPVFIWKDWKDCIDKNGFVLFGHIHGRNTLGKKIFYPGSFTRWNFGERSEKGFAVFEIEKELGETISYNVKYINNTEAPVYEVFQLKDIVKDIEKASADDIRQEIEKLLEKFDNIRLDVVSLSEEKVKILKEHYQNNPNVKLETRGRKTNQLKDTEDEELNKEFEKYHYITKKQLPLPETVQRFCKEELNVELDLDTIKNILKGEDE